MWSRCTVWAATLLVALVGSGAVYGESTDEWLATLIESNDRIVLEEAVQMLSRFTLEAAQVERLIQAAKNDNSDARRAYLQRAIFEAQSSAGHQYLEEVLTKEAEDGAIVEFLTRIGGLRVGDVPLLTAIYEARESERVRDAVVRLATTRSDDLLLNTVRPMMATGTDSEDARRARMRHDAVRRVREQETSEAQDALIRWIVGKSENEKYIFAAARSANSRPGVNPFGESVMTQALARELSPDLRAKLWATRMERGSGRMLRTLLYSDEPETVKLAGLAAAKRELLDDRRPLSGFADRELLQALTRASQEDLSEKVRQACTDILASARRHAVADTINNIKRQITHLQTMAGEIAKLPEGERKAFKQHPAMLSLQGQRAIEELESSFGELTAEERKQLAEATKELTAAAEKLARESAAPNEPSR